MHQRGSKLIQDQVRGFESYAPTWIKVDPGSSKRFWIVCTNVDQSWSRIK